jgi:hypothetical protein
MKQTALRTQNFSTLLTVSAKICIVAKTHEKHGTPVAVPGNRTAKTNRKVRQDST